MLKRWLDSLAETRVYRLEQMKKLEEIEERQAERNAAELNTRIPTWLCGYDGEVCRFTKCVAWKPSRVFVNWEDDFSVTKPYCSAFDKSV